MCDVANDEVAQRLRAVRERIERACVAAGRAPTEVLLVAVSKKQPDERVRAGHAAGLRNFGENYVQELVRKKPALALDGAAWHFIGHLQTNKAKQAAVADWVHSLDSERLAAALASAIEPGRRCRVLVQVNVSGEASKSGVAPGDAAALVAAARAHAALDVRGLMTLPAPGEGRRAFAALRTLRDRIADAQGVALPELSMGTSDDFEDAILEGATIVRVGAAIFGERV
jgi:pyridoxal phosphate enzyme (YggS family)